MKRLLTAMAIAAAAIHPALSAGPVARPEATVVEGNARFTVLTPEMIRIEYSPSGKFEDNATFAVINRDLPVPEFSRQPEALGVVVAVCVGISDPETAGTALVGLVCDGRTARDEVESRIDVSVDIGEMIAAVGIKFNNAIVGTALGDGSQRTRRPFDIYLGQSPRLDL